MGLAEHVRVGMAVQIGVAVNLTEGVNVGLRLELWLGVRVGIDQSIVVTVWASGLVMCCSWASMERLVSSLTWERL